MLTGYPRKGHPTTPDDSLSPSRSDIRVSYLEQYEINANRSYEDEQQFDDTGNNQTWGGIPDKYGFEWDRQGKLVKKNNKSILTQEQFNSHSRIEPFVCDAPAQKNNHKKRRTEPLRELRTSNLCPEIDQRINQIFSKYSPSKSQVAEKKSEQKFQEKQQNKFEQLEEEESSMPYFGTTKKKQKKVTNKAKILEGNEKTNRKNKDQASIRQPPRKITPEKCEKEKSRDIELQNKILGITEKIKQFEKQKEQLQIEFTKFQPMQCDEKIPITDRKERSMTKNRRAFQKKKKGVLLQSNQKNKKTLPTPSALKKNTRQQNSQKTIEKKSPVESQVSQKSTSTHNSVKKDIRTTKLIEKICRQIDLDQELRNAKIWFQNNDDPHKWGILSDKLSRDGTSMKYRELVDKFTSTTEEHNPFFSIKESNESYLTLINKYRVAEQNWSGQICHQFNEQDFEESNFSNKQLDVERKGCVKVEDLVRYINMRTKNFYRSRDLTLVFSRFAGKNKKEVHFSQMLRILSQAG